MKGLFFASLAAALTLAAPALASEVSVHDPSIIKADGIYYIFGTHITAAKSEDLINWTEFTNGYTTPDNSLFGDLSENLAGSFAWAGEDDVDSAGGFAVWAPDVYYNPDYINNDGSRGAYLMYYSASSTYNRSCIGLAASQNVEGPYSYVDTLIYSGFTKVDHWDSGSRINTNYTNTNLGALISEGKVSGYNDSWGTSAYNSSYAPNCIDPCVYEDTDGGLWLVYGSWSGGIFTLKLDNETGRPIYPGKDGATENGNPIDRYFGTKLAGGNGLSGEGPFIYYDDEAGYFFLQDTYEWLGEDGGYHIRMFRSKNPDGPFVDAMGRNAIYETNTLSYQGLKLFGNYRFDEMPLAYKSGGHCSTLIDDDGQRYLFYHTRFSDSGGYFESRVHQMFLNEDGWPVVAPYRYLGSKISENGYDTEEIAGYYQYINHGSSTGRGGTYETPTSVYLSADGTVRGDAEGHWSMNGKYVTLTLNDGTYKGVFFKQKNESGVEVMTFSAAGSNNCSIWGCKADDSISAASYAYYSLNGSLDGAAAVAYTVSGSNPVEIDKTVTYKDGISGKALRMDGTFGLKLPAVGALKSYAVSLWIKPDSLRQYSPIVAASDDFAGETRNGKQIWLNLTTFGSANDSYIWSRNDNLGIWPFVRKAGIYKTGEWQHVIISVDAEIPGEGTNCVRGSLYINGTKVSQGDVADGILENGGNIYIGANAWDAYFTGLVSDVRIYAASLNTAQAASVYENSLKKGFSLNAYRSGEVITVEIDGELPIGKALIEAAYKNGELLEVNAVTVEKSVYEFKTSVPADAELKVFVWDSLSGMMPEEKAVDVTSE